MPNSITTSYKKFKEHKGSIRFTADKSWMTTDPSTPFEPNPIRDIYVDRAWSNGVNEMELVLRVK